MDIIAFNLCFFCSIVMGYDYMKKRFFLSIVIVITVMSCILAILYLDIFPDFQEYSKTDTSLVSIITIVAGICFSGVLSGVIIAREKAEHVFYDRIREHMETEISQIQMKLSKNEEQWKLSNHLILSAQQHNASDLNGNISILKFLQKTGLTYDDLKIDDKMIFMLTPFSESAQNIFNCCQEVCSDFNLNLVRGDEDFTTSDIYSDIIRYIVKSRFIIANIDGKNPNVFYELGVAHTLSKAVVLISNKSFDIPFDIQNYRIIFYNDIEELEHDLKNSLPAILNQTNIETVKGKEISIASYLHSAEKDKDALQYFLHAIHADPQNVNATLGIAKIYARNKVFDEADAWTKRALQIYPHSQKVLLETAKIYYIMGKYQEAKKYCEEVLSDDPDNTDALTILGMLSLGTYDSKDIQ